ncbi:MAG TPA: hypothetical protein VJZ71_11100 [Phycisphaerae bacterium]|nr:hypothetical protein [Phycisphaerae bacterium]
MKVKIGNIEFSDLTPEELDEIVARYGSIELASAATSNLDSSRSGSGRLTGAGHADTVLLHKFVESATTGLSTNEIAEMLQRRGRALPKAVEAWARRVGLKEGTLDPFEYCRVGTKRHIRIKQSVLEVAKRLAAHNR